MKLLIIFIVSFVVLYAYAGENEITESPEDDSTSTQQSSTTEAMCGPNEKYSMCKCRLADLCWTRILSERCLRCKPGCRCREGYKRRRRRSPCRPMSECRIMGK